MCAPTLTTCPSSTTQAWIASPSSLSRAASIENPNGFLNLISAFDHRLGEVDAGPSALEHGAMMCTDG